MSAVTILKNPLCIAISGQSGCGNTSVSSMLADALGINLVNYTFRSLAKEKNMDFETVCKLAEHDPRWDCIVDERQQELSFQSSCVVGSRLAIWLLTNATIKFYLYADEQERAKRIHMREGGAFKDRLAENQSRDARDIARYKNLYGINVLAYKAAADIVVNTHGKSKVFIVKTIINALEKKGLIKITK